MPWKVYIEETNDYEVEIPDSDAESQEEAEAVAMELVTQGQADDSYTGTSNRQVTQGEKA